MKVEDLDFSYPERLVATERKPVSRVMLVEGGKPRELESASELLPLFRDGDCLVINDTRVLRRRVFSESGLEILFIQPVVGEGTSASSSFGQPDLLTWEVLCPSSRWKAGTEQVLPNGVRLEIVQRGRPQIVRANQPLSEEYFEQVGEMPLPPYIQKARGERHNREADAGQYQTAWAKNDGSLAAPTASLHFSDIHLKELIKSGVKVAEITLHVGLGTFLPVTAENLDDHEMHAEFAAISAETWSLVQRTKASGGRVWALGTTATRALESAAHGLLAERPEGGFFGETALFIRPGFQFRAVDVLMTNFHQPKSTLLALVAAFAGLETVRHCYAWAIEREFRLFSYGDLSVWMK